MSNECELGCEIIRNFTLYTCPGIVVTFDPDAYALVSGGQCVSECAFNPGTWWHFTDFQNYFTCFEYYKDNCDYWEIYRMCSPMLDELLSGLQALSFICCVFVLYRLHKETHRGMLQQSLFISIAHNLVQGIVSEEFYNVWAMYLLPKGDGRSILALSFRFAHVWIIFGSLMWSLVTALVLLNITEGQKRCMGLVAFFQRHKVAIIVAFECSMMVMSAISVVARLKVWKDFFLAFLITCLVAVLAGVVCYSIPALRAKRMQQRLAQQLKRRGSSMDLQQVRTHKPSPPRIQLKPFLLLLTVLLLTYGPFFVVYSQPTHMRTRVGYLVSWAFLELVGLWNCLGLLVVYIGRKHVGDKHMRVWNRNNRLVGRANIVVIGSHPFVRKHNQVYWHINPDTSVFGMGSMGDDLEDAFAGDIEQSSRGSLIRWMKRPSRYPHNSIQAVGLPLEKFQLFVDPALAPFFPPDVLTPLPTGIGFGMAVNITSQEAEQRLHVQAVEEYEEVSLHWKCLRDDRAAPTDEPVNQFEQAQLNWAYEEALLKLKACIEVLVRWRRSPTSTTNPSSSPSPQSDFTLLSKRQEEKKSESLEIPLTDRASGEVTFTKETESDERLNTIDTQIALFT